MKIILAENKYGHGALPVSKFRRYINKKLRTKVAYASQPFDWSIITDNSAGIKIKDQGTSGSCSGQAGSYALQVLNNSNQLSAKSIYSNIYYPGGGSTVTALESQIGVRGANLEAEIPSYNVYGNPLDEQDYEETSWQTPNTIQEAVKCAGWLPIDIEVNIDAIASAVRDYKAVIIEIQGKNNGTWLSPVPSAPSIDSDLWAHFITGMGVMIKDGQKTIKFANSWGTDTGEQGFQYLTEAYINSGYIVDVFALYPANQIVSLPVATNPFWVGVWLWFRQQKAILKSLININNN